eukprot:Gb_11785 [translate_table: standard]
MELDNAAFLGSEVECLEPVVNDVTRAANPNISTILTPCPPNEEMTKVITNTEVSGFLFFHLLSVYPVSYRAGLIKVSFGKPSFPRYLVVPCIWGIIHCWQWDFKCLWTSGLDRQWLCDHKVANAALPLFRPSLLYP